MKLFKKFFPVVLGALLLSGTALAQGEQMKDAAADSISDKELTSFVKITKKVQTMQQTTQVEMQSVIEDEGMTIPRFQKIMQSKQNPKAAGDVEVTKEEEETIKKIQPELQQMGQKSQQEQIAVIQDNGLSVQRYQKIAQIVQSDPAMLQKVQKMMTDTTDKEMEEDGSGN